MNLIGIINDEDTKSNIFPTAIKNWDARIAVRAALFNNEGKVALMHIGKYDMYKLPGGGVDQEEDLATAFVREMKEETGCEAKAVGDLGVFIEHRGEWELAQVSFCYLAEVINEGELNLTEEEIEEKFSLQWYEIDGAIKRISESKSERYGDRYIRIRDAQILKTAKLLKNNMVRTISSNVM